jgi:EAL domain-containing protein (putative c-di-GMP-specific phosphodiesterase class I)
VSEDTPDDRARAGGPAASGGWYLESRGEDGRLRRITLQVLPFRIGRRQGLELVLPADSVSKTHAEIYWRGSVLRVRDLGSTNGTYLNRGVVEDAPLGEGDVLHFADFEFRVGRSRATEAAPAVSTEETTTAALRRKELPHRLAAGTRELRQLLAEEIVTVVYQPIVRLAQGQVAAYEALGRGRHPQLPESPLELFRIAESIGAEAELSRLLRKKAVELVADRADPPPLFLNTHPVEFARPGLIESLDELRVMAPRLDLTLEIHESVLTRPEAIRELRTLLLERGIALAYDDFGAGQARLMELAEAPPHFLKFDRRFVSGLDQAPLPKRRLLQSLVALARELQVRTVAEGVETAGERQACHDLGFTHAQGFAIARPHALDPA